MCDTGDSPRHRRRAWWASLIVPQLLLGLAMGISAAAPVATAAAAVQVGGCAGPVSRQHIYDCAEILSSAEIAYLEAQAAAVEQAGAPTVVFLQARNATAQQALQDAIDLMNHWNV